MAMFTARNELTEIAGRRFLHLIYHLSADAGSCLESANVYPYGFQPIYPPNLNRMLGMDNAVQGFTWPRLCCRAFNCANSR